jgi:hypothetical protein
MKLRGWLIGFLSNLLPFRLSLSAQSSCFSLNSFCVFWNEAFFQTLNVKENPLHLIGNKISYLCGLWGYFTFLIL